MEYSKLKSNSSKNIDYIEETFLSFGAITGLKPQLWNKEGKISTLNLNAVSHCEFCQLIQSSPEGKKKCLETYAKANQSSKKPSEPKICRCHAGLSLWVVALNSDLTIICSQGLLTENIPSFEIAAEYLGNELNLDNNQIKNAISKFDSLSKVQEKAISHILKIIAKEITSNENNNKTINTTGKVTAIKKIKPKNNVNNQKNKENLKAVYAAGDYIQDHFKEKISLSAISSEVGLSIGYLSHIFSQTFNYTITEYITYIRIEHAKSFFHKGNISIKEAAKNSGFEDVSYFSRVFKKLEGISPREYKKLLQSNK
ncbi:MAG: PocR ligand-binding domain-containing protein [Clostridiales bacterium]